MTIHISHPSQKPHFSLPLLWQRLSEAAKEIFEKVVPPLESILHSQHLKPLPNFWRGADVEPFAQLMPSPYYLHHFGISVSWWVLLFKCFA